MQYDIENIVFSSKNILVNGENILKEPLTLVCESQLQYPDDIYLIMGQTKR